MFPEDMLAVVAAKEAAAIRLSAEVKAAFADDVGQFEFEHAGLRCFVRRFDKMSNWCGYVLLPPGHPWREEEHPNASVHGGVTWNRDRKGHLDNVDGWLCGFDTKHWGDHLADDTVYRGPWRNRAYVEAECRSLAEQAAEAAKG